MLTRDIKLLGLGEERSVRDNESAVSGSEGAVGMLAQAINSNSQGLGQQPVVGVEENQVFAPALLELCVSGACNPQLFLANVPYPRVAGSHLRGVVGGAIVHNEDLAMGIGLS